MQPRPRLIIRISLLLALALTACKTNPEAEAPAQPNNVAFIAQAAHSPPFARMPYERFTRTDAVAIAEQEWRLFGERVDDDPPRGDVELAPQDHLERSPGLWERIGEYWWLGQDADRRESAWTGMHNENGDEFEARRYDDFAWSAAFISYVMRTAGAGARFPYSPSHSVYINVAK